MKYYIISGEPSGDLHASNIVHHLKGLDASATFRAWGGENLKKQGVSIVKNIKDFSYMGILDVVLNLKSIRNNISFCKKDLLEFHPDALILVDYAGFNLRIAEFAKKHGIKVFYYIPPKLWAWNKSRIFKIKKYVDNLIVIFPFEKEFYRKYDIQAFYFGNPIIDEINKKHKDLSLSSSKPIISLLPGSRKQEIDKIFPIMLSIIHSEFAKNFQFVVACSTNIDINYYKKFTNKFSNIILVYNQTYSLLTKSKFALITSGTASLEAALLGVPQIVCYKTNYLTYILAKLIIKVQYISLVNILLADYIRNSSNVPVVKELIQKQLSKDNLLKEIDLLTKYSDKQITAYKELKSIIKINKNPSKNISEFIYSSIT